MCNSEAPRNYVYIYIVYIFIYRLYSRACDFFSVCIIYIYFIFISRKKTRSPGKMKDITR